MSRRDHIRIQGWTLSETLVMLIIAGVVFLTVMDGITLFIRYTRGKTLEITENMRLYEGYYHLEHMAASADSVSAEEGFMRLYRDGNALAELYESDSLLIVRLGVRTDTLMPAVSGLSIAGTGPKSVADTIKFVVREGDETRLNISFPIQLQAHKIITDNLREQEKEYAYEEP